MLLLTLFKVLVVHWSAVKLTNFLHNLYFFNLLLSVPDLFGHTLFMGKISFLSLPNKIIVVSLH